MAKTRLDLGIVQETLLIPLWARAIEAGKVNPILRDLKAVEILEQIDYDFSKFVKAKASQVGACLRGMLIDVWARSFLKENPAGTVVEIGAGLDTRYERLDNGRLRWFDLDLPDSMEVRRRFFKETERRIFLSGCVLEGSWVKRVKQSGAGPFFFIAEGVLIYFPEEQVKELFTLLADNFSGSRLAFDAMAPFMVKYQRHHDSVRHMSAMFAWGIREIREIESWDRRFNIEESVSFGDAGNGHYKRLPLWFRLMYSLIPGFRHICRINLAHFK